MRRAGLAVIGAAAVAGLLAGMLAVHRLDSPGSPPVAPPPAPAGGLAEGDFLPAELALTLRDGRRLRLAELRGRPVLVNAWASWCGPCVEEMPQLAAFSREQGDNGIQVIGLALDTPDAVDAFLERVPVPYPIAVETPGPADTSVLLGNERGLLPYTVLVDADGRLVKRKLGPFREGEIARWASNDG